MNYKPATTNDKRNNKRSEFYFKLNHLVLSTSIGSRLISLKNILERTVMTLQIDS